MRPATRLSADQLAEIGRLLYGDRWQSQMAREREVAQPTIAALASGRRPVPVDYGPALRQMIEARIKELRAALRKLK